MTVQDRHLSGDNFVEYLSLGVPIDHPIEGTPRLVLFFDPDHRRIGLRGPARGNETPVATGLEYLNIRLVHLGGERLVEIAVNHPPLFVDAYPVLCGVADRTQVDGMSLSVALRETLQRLGHLIRAEESLSREVEIGLVGELMLMIGLSSVATPEKALQAWRGGSEEHDFGLPDLDVEIKTTTSEHRKHRISSLTQLQPTGDRALWLLSLQITPAGSGGTTVAEIIQRARAMLATSQLRDEFDRRSQAAGWRHRYADSTLQSWRLRTEPALFAVTPIFPRLTPSLLEAAGVDLTVISDIKYRLDLTGRAPDPAPAQLGGAVTAGREELR